MNTVKGGNYEYYSGSVEYAGSQIRILGEYNTISGTISIAGALNKGNFTVNNVSYLIVGYTTLSVDQAITAGAENVVISAYSADYNLLYRPAYDSITGVLHPTKVFNTEFSPKHILFNNGGLLQSLLDKQGMNFIKYQTGEKNSELSTTLNGVTVSEKADIQIATLKDKLFLPYYFTFKVPTEYNFKEKIEMNPYGKISFLSEGKKFYGYLFDGGVQQATRDVQSMKLICAPETDLLQLID